jgi:hypothetical protein
LISGSLKTRLTSKTLCLGINISQPKEEKIYICNSSQSHSKGFDFSIKRFGGGIGGTISKEIEYFVIVFINSGRDGIERFKFRVGNFVIPLG